VGRRVVTLTQPAPYTSSTEFPEKPRPVATAISTWTVLVAGNSVIVTVIVIVVVPRTIGRFAEAVDSVDGNMMPPRTTVPVSALTSEHFAVTVTGTPTLNCVPAAGSADTSVQPSIVGCVGLDPHAIRTAQAASASALVTPRKCRRMSVPMISHPLFL
jgi:hypothetical protein